jgi:hypothetical protein
MELSQSRESVLHFFELIQKKYPSMRNFYCRDRGECVLEEDKSRGHYRWATVENRRVCSGYVNPASMEEVISQHELILETAPFALSVSSLDCESLNLMYGFDFTYRGNHSQLIREVLGAPTALESVADLAGATTIAYDPSIQFALDEDCRLQCRLSVETRTSAYHVRTGEYPEEQLSVYVTARRYGSLDPGESMTDILHRLDDICREVVDNHVLENVLLPMQQLIATR